MRKIIYFLMAVLAAASLSSCLKHDLEDLDVFKECDITGVQGVYWRYYGTEKIPGSDQVQVKQVRIPSGNFRADNEAGTCEFAYQLNHQFPADQKSEFTPKKLVVILNISSAAKIEPMEGAPVLGKPGDWSKVNKYKVTGADGSTKVWTITATQL